MAYTKEEIEQMKKELGITDSDEFDDKNDNKSRTILTLDDVAAESNAIKTQDKWIEYWNNTNRIFPSMPQLYQQFKLITEDLDANKQLLDSLRNDFKARCLSCSTRINYNANAKYAKIIHNFGSRLEKEPIGLEIPVYLKNNTIEEVLRQEKGLNFLKKFLQTEDSEEEIIQVFEKLSNKTRNKMRIWTPPFNGYIYTTRSKKLERAVSLLYGFGNFHIDCGSLNGDFGRSRSVAVSALKYFKS